MIVRALSGSLLLVLVIAPSNGSFGTRLDGNNDSSTGSPTNASLLNESNASTPFVASFNETGIILKTSGIPGSDEAEQRTTDPNVRDNSDPKVRDHSDPNVRDHSDPNVRDHSDPNVRNHLDPNVRDHSDPNVRDHSDPNVRDHSDPNVRNHSDPNVRDHSDPNVRNHLDPNVRDHSDPNVRDHSDPNVRDHLDPNVRDHSDPNVRDHSDPNVRDHSDPNVKDHSDNRTKGKDSTISSHPRDPDMKYAYTTMKVDKSTTSLKTSTTVLIQHDPAPKNDESKGVTGQELTSKSRVLHTEYASAAPDSAPFKKNCTDETTSSRVSTGSSGVNVPGNKDTHSSGKTAGITEATGIMAGLAGLLKRTETRHQVLLSTTAGAIDATTPDFKMETRPDQAFGTSADDQMTQTNDVRNRKRDVNVTRSEVTKAEFSYRNLWNDENTQDEEGKMEADGGGVGKFGSSTVGIAEEGRTGKRIKGRREEDGKFTIPVELRKARSRNEHFSLSFHGLPWREELNILVPVLCGMFGAMILVLAAYFLRNCPNNIRRLLRMNRESKLHRRKSDLNLLIDNSSGDEHP